MNPDEENHPRALPRHFPFECWDWAPAEVRLETTAESSAPQAALPLEGTADILGSRGHFFLPVAFTSRQR